MNRGNIIWLVLVVACCFTTAVAVWVYYDTRQQPDPHTTKWPHRFEYEDPTPDKADLDASQKRMSRVRDAIQRYQRDLGETYYPETLNELVAMDYVEPDDLRGVLSGREILYSPDVPVEENPSRWVVACDARWGNQRMEGRYRSVRVVVAATVLLANGDVRTLGMEEIDRYAGLQLMLDATR